MKIIKYTSKFCHELHADPPHPKICTDNPAYLRHISGLSEAVAVTVAVTVAVAVAVAVAMIKFNEMK